MGNDSTVFDEGVEMNADEQYVREHWQHITYREPFVLFGSLSGDGMYDDKTCIGWMAAAEFTRAHKAKVADVEEEIALIESWLPAIMGTSDMTGATWRRILVARQAALAELRRGMVVKEEKR